MDVYSSVEDLSITKSLSGKLKKYRSIKDSITEDIIEESKNYDDSFEQNSEETTIKSTQMRLKSKSNHSIQYSNTFISDSSSSSSDSSELTETDLIQSGLRSLRKRDIVEYLKAKINLEKRKEINKQPNIKIKPQVIKRIKQNQNKTIANNDLKENTKIQVDKYLINRIKTQNSIKALEKEQLEKIEKLGEDLEVNKDKQKQHEKYQNAYFNQKASQIKSKAINDHLIEHEINYCDSLILIANLANSFPRFSDPPEQVWKKLIKPLKLK